MVINRAAGAAAIVLIAFVGCKSNPSGVSPAPAPPATPVFTPGLAPPTTASTPPQAADRKGLPDPTLTPGDRDSKPNKRTVLPPATQKKVLEAYGVPPGDSQFVVCRLIPPEIGGTNNAANLFATTPWFANLKARLDSKLVQLVQSKQITADQAVSDLKGNWVKAAHKHYVRNYGEGTKAGAKQKEDQIRWEQ